MITNKNFVLKLLRSYHAVNQSPLPAISLSDSEVDYLYKRGLASAVVASFDLVELSDYARDVLRSADLTSRVVCEQIRSATIDVLVSASHQDVPVVLMKGIWIAENMYPAPHHRTMGDIDVLVQMQKAKFLYDILLERGYLNPTFGSGPRIPEGHHHLPELRNPDNNVPVEVHTSLISRTMLANEKLFQISTLWEQTQPAEFCGLQCLKFRPEFQLLYTVAHWAIDYKWPKNLISINDTILMLRNDDPPLDWTLIKIWLVESPVIADILAVLLLFLKDAGIVTVPSAIVQNVEDSARRIGRINLKVLHWLLIQFPFSGRKKVAWAITSLNARVLWLTLLEPRHRSLRLIVAISRILLRRTRGMSLLGSTAGRIRTLLEPNG